MLKAYTRFILALPLSLLSFAALAQTAPSPDKPKQSGFVSPDGSLASVLTPEQKQASDETADQIFQNEMKLRVIQSELALAKAKAEIAKLTPEVEKANPALVPPKQAVAINPATITTSAIPAPVSASIDKPKLDTTLETRFKILTIMGPVDQLVATLKIDRLGSIQVRKNDPIPNYDLTVFDIDRHKVSLKTSTGEIVYIPFIL